MHSVDVTHDTSLLPFHIKDLATFGQTLTEAAAAAYPTTGTSVRYKAVHVLLLSWVDDNLGVLEEISELDGAFTSIYGYATEQWKIPSTRSHNSLAKQLTGFLERYESEENLLIVYYGGHGYMNDNRQCVWSCTGADDSPTVQWSALQTMFEQAASDVVLLLDCCAAASSTGEAGGSLTELIAACGFETEAPGVGEHSFTRSLIEELRGWNHRITMSVAKLHSEVLARIKHWKPRYASDGNRERRNTPVYVLLANEGKPRSIELTPLKRCEMSKSEALSAGPLYTPPDSDEDVEMSEVPDGNITPSSHLSDSLTAVCPEDRYPKVIISVALEEDQVLHTQDWCEWLKSVPAIVKFARVQGIYKSDSTLVIMTIPVVIWDLIPSDPAIAFLGFVKSGNLLSSSSEFPGSEVTCLQPSHHSVSKQRQSNFSVTIGINDHICKASIRPESHSSIITSACVERCDLTRLIDNESSNLWPNREPTKFLPRTSQLMIDVGTTTLSHIFVVVDSTDDTVSLGADFFKAHHAYTDTVRQSLIINGKKVKLLVESEHLDNTKMSQKRSPDEPMLLTKGAVTQKTATSAENLALEGMDTIEAQLGSLKKISKARKQQQINGTLGMNNIYQPLCADNMFRLVVLEPASDYFATIRCSLKVVSLDDEPLYEAMSYVREAPSCTSPILLDGNIFEVTSGVERALRHLQCSRHEALVLWIDAICMDQQNVIECDSQALLLNSIYRQARGVLAWLGEGTASSLRAIKFLEHLNDERILLELEDILSSPKLEQFWSIVHESEFSDSWQSLWELFSRPWRDNPWVLWELAFAREVTMQCGSLHFNFALVVRPAPLLSMLLVDYEHAESFALQYESPGQYKIPDNIKQTVEIWSGAVQNFITLKMRLKSFSGPTLMAALIQCSRCKRTDPRDRIFASVDLVQQRNALTPILTNYELKRHHDVFLQVARSILDVEQDPGSQLWNSVHPRLVYDMPLWARDWTRISARSRTSPRWIPSLNTDSTLEVGRHGTVPSKRISVQGRVLKVRGIQADTLNEIGKIYPFPKVTFGQFSELSQEAQRKVYGAQPRMQETAWWEAFLNHNCEQHVNMTRLAESTEGIGTSSITLYRSPITPFKKHDTCTHPDFNRLKYISITPRGYVCFVPPGSQAGDVVCVLVGARAPSILRRTDDGTRFRFVGECYVHGLMDKNVVCETLDSNYEEEEILIV